MNRRKIVIYSIFVLVAIYGFHFHFLSDKPEKKPAFAEPSRPGSQAASVEATSEFPALVKPADPVQLSGPRHYRLRNPFENRKNMQVKAVTAVSPIQHSRPEISAISTDGTESLVIANNKIIKIGEKIGVWKLMRVETDKALFEGPDGSIWIYLGG